LKVEVIVVTVSGFHFRSKCEGGQGAGQVTMTANKHDVHTSWVDYIPYALQGTVYVICAGLGMDNVTEQLDLLFIMKNSVLECL